MSSVRALPPESAVTRFADAQALAAPGMAQVNALIRARLASDVVLINQIAEHIIGGGGKRLRPMLTVAAALVFDHPTGAQTNYAAAVEFMHNATLLHDDVVDESALRRGQASVWAMGVRMSGEPSWARVEPSTYSTMEWITDWGWTSTSIRPSGTANSRLASISSSPLFISVALSTEILAPMAQFGWRTASAGVAAAMRSSVQSRNGPPLAVRMMRATASGRCNCSAKTMRQPA